MKQWKYILIYFFGGNKLQRKVNREKDGKVRIPRYDTFSLFNYDGTASDANITHVNAMLGWNRRVFDLDRAARTARGAGKL
jgi:hypothetical protein